MNRLPVWPVEIGAAFDKREIVDNPWRERLLGRAELEFPFPPSHDESPLEGGQGNVELMPRASLDRLRRLGGF